MGGREGKGEADKLGGEELWRDGGRPTSGKGRSSSGIWRREDEGDTEGGGSDPNAWRRE